MKKLLKCLKINEIVKIIEYLNSWDMTNYHTRVKHVFCLSTIRNASHLPI